MSDTEAPSAEVPRNERVGGARARITEMAEIPRLQPAELDRLGIVHPLMPRPEVLAQFQSLLGKLVERTDGRNFVVGVYPVVPGAGASFVSINLAATIALDHHRTALQIEGGPGSPILNALLMLPPDYGLNDFLADPAMDVESIIYSSRVPRLRVIPFGRMHAETRLLHSAGMQHLIEVARARYSDRFIVLDVPANTAPESLRRLALWCDFFVLVVPYGGASIAQLRAAAEAVGRERVAGVVLNRDPGPG